ncbi:hypothetical protein AB0J27_17485 [Micromonospora chokoriensis]
MRFWEPTLFPEFAPKDPAEALKDLWQVHSSFVGIAFAGLAILFQLASAPVVTSHSLRADLFRHTFFAPNLTFALSGAIQLGVVTLWFSSAAAVAIEFLTVVTVTLIGVALAYLRAGRLFVHPSAALEIGRAALVDQALDSMYEDWARTEANRRLENLIGNSTASGLAKSQTGKAIALAPRSATIEDVRIAPIRDAVREVEVATTATAAQSNPNLGELQQGLSNPSRELPNLKILVRIGSSVRKNSPLFVIENAHAFSGDTERIEKRLLGAIKWGAGD